MTREITMEVIVIAENDEAWERLLEDDDAEVWDEESNQIAVSNVTHAAGSISGGVHLHRPEGDEDLSWPTIEDGRSKIVTPPIEIISARPTSGQTIEDSAPQQ